jgi:hypothetical protein
MDLYPLGILLPAGSDPEDHTMTDTDTDTDTDTEMLTLTEAAQLLRKPVATLRYWRHLGEGPRSFKVGRNVRHWRRDVLNWLHTQADDPQSA